MPDIVLVEDRSLVGRDIQRKLENFGYTVTDLVGSGDATLEAVRSNKPDLILMDVNLKGEMDGIETVDKISEDYDIHVVFMTAYSEEKIIERIEESGAEGYLLKPIEETELEKLLKVILSGDDMNVSLERGKFFSGQTSVS